MKIKTIARILISMTILALSIAAETDRWASKKYKAIPIPQEWQKLANPDMKRKKELIENWTYNDLGIANILKVLGLPDRIQKDQEDQHYMIYKLEAGFTFIVFLGTGCDIKYHPLAAALEDKSGSTIHLMK